MLLGYVQASLLASLSERFDIKQSVGACGLVAQFNGTKMILVIPNNIFDGNIFIYFFSRDCMSSQQLVDYVREQLNSVSS